MGTAELTAFVQLGTFDSCEARVPTDRDHRDEMCPEWCELILDISREGKTMRHYFRRHDGEAVIEALHTVLRPNSGRTIQQGIWADLDDVYASIKAGDRSEATKGRALGLAMALARLRSSSVDVIRAEARDRYLAR